MTCACDPMTLASKFLVQSVLPGLVRPRALQQYTYLFIRTSPLRGWSWSLLLVRPPQAQLPLDSSGRHTRNADAHDFGCALAMDAKWLVDLG